MKIFFRYLFLRLLQPFLFCLAAFTLLWVMGDLYGTLDEFLEHKVKVLVILHYYALQIPRMLVQVLPATTLFSTLFTLLSLNRRSELVALQAGGMAPVWMFSPFLLFGLVVAAVLAYDLSGPAAHAEVARERLLKEVKGQTLGVNALANLLYVDKVNHRNWFFQTLNASGNSGKAEGVDIMQQNAQGQDMEEYAAREARWNGSFWRLTGVKKIVYDSDGTALQDQKQYAELDLADFTTPPKQLSLILSQPEQLSTPQLGEYIAASTQTTAFLAQYRTEWWYRVLYPFSVLILMLYGLIQGARSDRRSPGAGIGLAILVLVLFSVFLALGMAAGKNNRLSPFVAVSLTEIIFAGIALHQLAMSNGWYWQLREWYTTWRADRVADRKADAL